MSTAPALTLSILVFLGATQSVIAANYDGSQPFRCAPVNIVGCDADGQCGKETTDSVDLPRVLKFDFAQKEITGKRPNGDALTATIDQIQHVEDRLILQGVEAGTMWGVMVAETSGDMTMTVGGERVGFVGFGACSPE
jgi:hypothetical protein